MLLRFIENYGEIEKGTVRNTRSDEDAQTLIDSNVAEKYVPTEDTEQQEADQHQKTVDAIAKKVLSQIAVESKKNNKAQQYQASSEDNPSGFKSLGDFAQSVMKGTSDRKLGAYCSKISGMGEAIGADGGFLIPPEFSTALLTAMAQTASLAPRTMNFAVNNNLALPFVNIASQATSWTGGVTVYKPAEGIAKTASLPQLAKCELKLYKMAALIYATDELLNDSPAALQSFLTTMCATEFALTKDEDIVNGSGAGEALGILNAPATISVAKDAGQAAATITYSNVERMWSRLYNPSRGKAVWLINQDCMPQIASMAVNVGTGGAPVFVVNATTALPTTIFGAPIIWSPHCQTLGTAGDIILADLSQYVTITKAGMNLESASSIHLKFAEDETAFRFVVRFDGQPWWASAMTPKHGSNTVSPFVTVAVRA